MARPHPNPLPQERGLAFAASGTVTDHYFKSDNLGLRIVSPDGGHWQGHESLSIHASIRVNPPRGRGVRGSYQTRTA